VRGAYSKNLEPIRNTLSQKKIGWGAAPLRLYLSGFIRCIVKQLFG
jgi:hypothetical protein